MFFSNAMMVAAVGKPLQLDFTTQYAYPSYGGGSVNGANFILSGSTLYSIGGYINSSPTLCYSFGDVNSTGTLGSLTTSTVSTIANTALYLYKDYIFCFQGQTGAGYVNTILRLKVNANKTLSANATLPDPYIGSSGCFQGKTFQEDTTTFIVYNRKDGSNSAVVLSPYVYYINAINQPTGLGGLSTPFNKAGMTRPTGFNDVDDELFIKDGYIYYIVGGMLNGVTNIYYSVNTWDTTTKTIGATSNWSNWNTLQYTHDAGGYPRINHIFNIGSRVFTSPVAYSGNSSDRRILELFFSNGQITCSAFKLTGGDGYMQYLSLQSAYTFGYNNYYIGIENSTNNQFHIHKALP